MSDSDLFARLESADGDSPSNSQEGDESGSIPDSGISINEKPQLYEKLYVEDVGQDTKGGKRQVYDKNGCIIGSKLPQRYRMMMLMFACLGNFVVIVSRLYPSGFYLDFILTEDLSTTLGTISISIMLVTSAMSPLVNYCLPKSIKKSPLTIRCFVLCFVNAICIGLMSLVDLILQLDSTGNSAFATIFVLRGVQGIVVGLLYILVQGEIVDLYFKDDNMPIILISAFLQIGAILSAILSAELFVYGGWAFVGLVIACFNVFPLMLLPAVSTVHNDKNIKKNHGQGVKRELLAQNSVDSCIISERSNRFETVTSKTRKVAFYIPDLMVFFNNLVCDLIAYALPARIVLYSQIPLSTAVPLFQTGNLCSLFAALTFSYLASRNKKFDVIGLMATANIMYYFGSIVAFASTTTTMQFLGFPYQLLIGLVFMGIGEAGHLNLCIMSKFALYDKWNMRKTGLGKRSTILNNIALSLSSAAGTAISGYSLTEESEIPTVATLIGLGVCLTAVTLFCKHVK